jgi:hypothetical protein
MTKQFLTWGGLILIILGILGLIGVLGPTASGSIFGNSWFFDMGQSWVNVIVGVIAILAAWVLNSESRRWIAGIIGILGLIVGVLGFVLPSSFSMILGPNPENLISNLFYLVMGVWGAWATWGMAESEVMGGEHHHRPVTA